jgi:hypothetical protein
MEVDMIRESSMNPQTKAEEHSREGPPSKACVCQNLYEIWKISSNGISLERVLRGQMMC